MTTIYLDKAPNEKWRDYLLRVTPFEKRAKVVAAFDELMVKWAEEREEARAAQHVMWEWGLLPGERRNQE